ncbi:1826_t:CDS:1, partial [Acaulospora morrowiae]
CARGLLLLVTTGVKESMKENGSAEHKSTKAEEDMPLINDRQVISSRFSFNGTAKKLTLYLPYRAQDKMSIAYLLQYWSLLTTLSAKSIFQFWDSKIPFLL